MSEQLSEGTSEQPDTPAGATVEGVDFAVLAYREEGTWQLEELDDDVLDDVEDIADELSRWPGDLGAIALISVDEDFAVLVRAVGDDVTALVSDVTAATVWPLARSVVELLDLPVPDDDDEPVPGGDPGLLADLGLPAMTLAALLDDEDLYPDEFLSAVADKLGFGEPFDEFVGLTDR
ncbi:tRNA adenosine deaminase-associated protein [Nocardioides massiliensis]|uniref:tRNA adenosine deaminase-associated protein n=1 Tax=Nocardioides massiliensis TaxID=1325935 RepID=A0ABT9NKY1_9ACTN|nr:tRNA adenosine deaminase-associated protein [Nocardioides massiliensis]MDP9821076.1 putative tRNA adenosine deaminase-associated protein [Nocardioides massiliensis]